MMFASSTRCGVLLTGFLIAAASFPTAAWTAGCGSWNPAIPSCYETRDGVALGLYNFGEGYTICFHGEGKVCRGGYWVTDLGKNCLNMPDTPLAGPSQRPVSCSHSDESARQPNADEIGNMGKPIGSPLGAFNRDDMPLPAPNPVMPFNAFSNMRRGAGGRPGGGFGAFGNNTRSKPTCSPQQVQQLRAEISQTEASCGGMWGRTHSQCANPTGARLIQLLQTELARCR